MPQLLAVQPTATVPRDPIEYTQTNFPALTPRQLAVLAQLETQDQQALRSSAHNVLQPSLQTMAGRPVQNTAPGQAQPASTTARLLEAGQDTQLRPSSEPHAAQRRDRRAVCHPRTAAAATPGHSIDAAADPEATVVTASHAAMVHAEPIDTDPGPLGPDRAFVLRSRSEEWMTKWSYRAPPPQPTGIREGASQSSRPPMEMSCVLHGLDPGDRSNTTTASIPIPATQLHSGPQQHHQPTTTTGDGETSSDDAPR